MLLFILLGLKIKQSLFVEEMLSLLSNSILLKFRKNSESSVLVSNNFSYPLSFTSLISKKIISLYLYINPF